MLLAASEVQVNYNYLARRTVLSIIKEQQPISENRSDYRTRSCS
jgi:hypothetical protein